MHLNEEINKVFSFKVGCSKGNYMGTHDVCEKCPFGTYQNNTDAAKCIPCPKKSNTTETGSDDIGMCLGKTNYIITIMIKNILCHVLFCTYKFK
jgi:hypothetical protein